MAQHGHSTRQKRTHGDRGGGEREENEGTKRSAAVRGEREGKEETRRGEREVEVLKSMADILPVTSSPPRRPHFSRGLGLPLFCAWALGEHLDPGCGSWFTGFL